MRMYLNNRADCFIAVFACESHAFHDLKLNFCFSARHAERFFHDAIVLKIDGLRSHGLDARS